MAPLDASFVSFVNFTFEAEEARTCNVGLKFTQESRHGIPIFVQDTYFWFKESNDDESNDDEDDEDDENYGYKVELAKLDGGFSVLYIQYYDKSGKIYYKSFRLELLIPSVEDLSPLSWYDIILPGPENKFISICAAETNITL